MRDLNDKILLISIFILLIIVTYIILVYYYYKTKELNILFKYALDTNFIKLVTKVTDFYKNYKNYKNENVNYKQEFILNNLRMMSSDYIIFL